MADELPAHLAAWARLAGPAKVIAAIRARAERGHSTLKGSLSCSLNEDERKQVGRLLGNPWNVSGKPVRLQDLAAALDGLSPLRLAELVGGPVALRADERAREKAEAEGLVSSAREALSAAGLDEQSIEVWLAENPRSVGIADQVSFIWKALPVEPVQLAQFAADMCHDAHALDDDQSLGRAVARMAAVVHGLERPQRSGPSWRAAWRAIGILCNEVSSRVLVLNLPLDGSAAAVALSAAAPGEPVWLTLRSLSGVWRPAFTGSVFVCENPTIVEPQRIASACAVPR